MFKVSVLMPIYKTQEIYLREAIESILRIKYFKNEKNLGISASRNKLIDMAQGEYLAVFDHDDISVPTRLEKQVSFLETHSEVGVISGQLEHFPKKKVTTHPENNLDIKVSLMQADVIAHTAMMVRASVLNKYGIRYEEEYSPAEDYKIVLQLLKYTMFHNIQEVLVKYRNFDGNTSHLQKEKMINADALCRCFAAKEYPYLYQQIKQPLCKRRLWLKLFGFIPLIKIKKMPNKSKVYLFGFIPLYSMKA